MTIVGYICINTEQQNSDKECRMLLAYVHRIKL